MIGTYGGFTYGSLPYGGAETITGAAAIEFCGTILGSDSSYNSIEGSVVDYRLNGNSTAYVTITGNDEECQG